MSILNLLNHIAVRTNATEMLCGGATKRIYARLQRFCGAEGGVVTVEWVALAAGLTIGAIAISFIIMNGLVAPSKHIASQLSP